MKLDYASREQEQAAHPVTHFVIAGLCIATFFVVTFVGGHGIAPVGLLLLWAEPDWGWPIYLAYAGLIAMVIAPFIRPTSIRALSMIIGVAVLLVSWIGVFRASDWNKFTLLTSFPFLSSCTVCLGWAIVQLLMQWKRS